MVLHLYIYIIIVLIMWDKIYDIVCFIAEIHVFSLPIYYFYTPCQASSPS